jgi:hypothetical protein
MRSLALSLTLAVAGAASGCTGTLTYPGSVEYRVAPGYDARRPADVAVLPVVGSLPEETATLLREALGRRLLELRYAPVRLKEVDAHVADYKPGGKNAVLEIRVTAWDDAGLFGDGTLRFSAEVRLFAAGSPEVLYAGRVENVSVQSSLVATSMDDRPTTVRQACDEAAGRLLEKLPVKGDG